MASEAHDGKSVDCVGRFATSPFGIQSAVSRANEIAISFEVMHIVLEARIGTQVKSTGNHWDADDQYPPYFQIISVIAHSYNIQPLFFDICNSVYVLYSRRSLKICFEASDWFMSVKDLLGGSRTSFLSIQNVEGNKSYTKL